MKKINLLLYFILFLPVVSAQQAITLNPLSNQVAPGEVLQVEIDLENAVGTLNAQHVRFYTASGTQQAVSPFIVPINENKYFLYFETPQAADGEYTLRLENMPFLVNNVLSILTEEVNVTLQSTASRVVITPGVFKEQAGATATFLVRTKALDQITGVQFTVPSFLSHPYQNEELLNPGVTRTFTFNGVVPQSIENETSIIINYAGTSFSIPVFIEGGSGQQSSGENTSTPLSESPLAFLVSESSLDRTIEKNQVLEGYVIIQHQGTENLNQVHLSLDGDLNKIVTLSPNKFTDVDPQENMSLLLKINEGKNPEQAIYEGNLIAETEGISITLPMKVIIEDEALPPPTVIPNEEDKLVDEFLGKDQNDSGEGFSFDDDLPPGVVPWNLTGGEFEEETRSLAGPFIWLIIILLAIAIIIFLLSGKKKKTTRSFSDVMGEVEGR